MTTQERIAAFPAVIAVDLRFAGTSTATPFGLVRPGERGYQPLYLPTHIGDAEINVLDELDDLVVRRFNTRRPTPAEREAAVVGSLFGWDIPGADPAQYDANGKLKGGKLEQAKVRLAR